MARKLSKRTWLHRLLASSSLPVYVVNPQRQVVFCNPACVEWTGISEEQLLEQRCDYHSASRPERPEEVAAALCPPPEAFLGRWACGALCLPGDDPMATRWAHFMPLGSQEDGASVGVLTWVAEKGAPATWQGRMEGDAGEPGPLHEQLRALRQAEMQRYLPNGVLGRSPAMVRVREQIRLAAATDVRVLIVGPAGSGREHVARAIHAGRAMQEGRAMHAARGVTDAPLVPLACGLLDAELLEATVTALARAGQDRDAQWSGTLLLLDVERLAPTAQTALFETLGQSPCGLRTLATSSVPLEAAWRNPETSDESFRGDLACALSTLVIELPALADREEDIGLLAQGFLEEHNADGGRQLSGLMSETLELLVGYDWPGNVEELASTMLQACGRAAGPWLVPGDLPEEIRLGRQVAARPQRPVETIDLDQFLQRIETELFRRAMRQAKGNKSRAARLLGLNRARFHRRLAQLGLDA